MPVPRAVIISRISSEESILSRRALLDVQDLALERQDGLEAAIASLLGGAAGGIALDEVDLAEARIALLAVGELAGERRGIERAFAAGQIARLARCFARAGGFDDLVDDAS